MYATLLRDHRFPLTCDQVYKDARFFNWGLNIENTPLYTCVPETVIGVIRIVKFAMEHNLSVRCAGFRKSTVSPRLEYH